MKTSRFIPLFLITSFLPCCTRYVDVPKPRGGQSAVGGSYIYTSLLSAQSAHVLGYDGMILEQSSQSLILDAGERKLALGASYPPGKQSFAELSVSLAPDTQYSVTASFSDDGLCIYRVLEYVGKKEIARVAAPAIPYTSWIPSTQFWQSKGWRLQQQKKKQNKSEMATPRKPSD